MNREILGPVLVLGVVAGGIYLLSRKAEAYPGNIVLSDMTILPTETYVGEPVEISVVATNIGGEQATKEIVCEVL